MYVSKNVVATTLGISSVVNSYLKNLTQAEAEQRLNDLAPTNKPKATFQP